MVDSMLVPVCDNYRIRRCRIYRSVAYRLEDWLLHEEVTLWSACKRNVKRQQAPYDKYILSYIHKQIETTLSQIARILQRTIHAVTARGFELKVALHVLAYSVSVA